MKIAQAYAAGASYASATFVKEAIGQRQQKRIQEAARRMAESPIERWGYGSGFDMGRNLTDMDRMDPRDIFPRNTVDRRKELAAQFREADATGTGKQVAAIRDKMLEGTTAPSSADIDRTLTSGRHNRSSVVQVPWIDNPKQVKNQPGFNPEKYLYKGEGNTASKFQPQQPYWTSAYPSVSSGYVPQHSKSVGLPGVGGRLKVFDAASIPEAKTAPFTPHIAEDPMSLTPKALQTNVRRSLAAQGKQQRSSPVGAAPFYEKVLRGQSLADSPPIAEYKALATPGGFQQVRGKVNPLLEPPVAASNPLANVKPTFVDRIGDGNAHVGRQLGSSNNFYARYQHTPLNGGAFMNAVSKVPNVFKRLR